MTRHQLWINLVAVLSLFLAFFGLAAAARFYFQSEALYATFRDFSSLLIAAAAAYLAYCFQRRQSFLASLRDLWKELVEAKIELVEYTHDPNPDQAAFNRAHRALSRAVDSVRGVYRNVGETGWKVGLYPFEPLHDMRRTLDELGFHDPSLDRRLIARARVIGSWNALRWAFLKEFSTPEPRHPITDRGMSDPRRTVR